MPYLLLQSQCIFSPRSHSLHVSIGTLQNRVLNIGSHAGLDIEAQQNGRCLLEMRFTKTVACICAVTIHMTGRHSGLFLLN